MGKVVKHLTDNNPDRVSEFKTKVQAGVKDVSFISLVLYLNIRPEVKLVM